MRKYTKSNPISNEYEKYLIQRCGVTATTAATYKHDLNRVSECMKSIGVVDDSIYEIDNVKYLRKALLKVLKSDIFKALPEEGYSGKNYKGRWVTTMDHYADFAAQNRRRFSHKCV